MERRFKFIRWTLAFNFLSNLNCTFSTPLFRTEVNTDSDIPEISLAEYKNSIDSTSSLTKNSDNTMASDIFTTEGYLPEVANNAFILYEHKSNNNFQLHLKTTGDQSEGTTIVSEPFAEVEVHFTNRNHTSTTKDNFKDEQATAVKVPASEKYLNSFKDIFSPSSTDDFPDSSERTVKNDPLGTIQITSEEEANYSSKTNSLITLNNFQNSSESTVQVESFSTASIPSIVTDMDSFDRIYSSTLSDDNPKTSIKFSDVHISTISASFLEKSTETGVLIPTIVSKNDDPVPIDVTLLPINDSVLQSSDSGCLTDRGVTSKSMITLQNNYVDSVASISNPLSKSDILSATIFTLHENNVNLDSSSEKDSGDMTTTTMTTQQENDVDLDSSNSTQVKDSDNSSSTTINLQENDADSDSNHSTHSENSDTFSTSTIILQDNNADSGSNQSTHSENCDTLPTTTIILDENDADSDSRHSTLSEDSDTFSTTAIILQENDADSVSSHSSLSEDSDAFSTPTIILQENDTDSDSSHSAFSEDSDVFSTNKIILQENNSDLDSIHSTHSEDSDNSSIILQENTDSNSNNSSPVTDSDIALTTAITLQEIDSNDSNSQEDASTAATALQEDEGISKNSVTNNSSFSNADEATSILPSFIGNAETPIAESSKQSNYTSASVGDSICSVCKSCTNDYIDRVLCDVTANLPPFLELPNRQGRFQLYYGKLFGLSTLERSDSAIVTCSSNDIYSVVVPLRMKYAKAFYKWQMEMPLRTFYGDINVTAVNVESRIFYSRSSSSSIVGGLKINALDNIQTEFSGLGPFNGMVARLTRAAISLFRSSFTSGFENALVEAINTELQDVKKYEEYYMIKE